MLDETLATNVNDRASSSRGNSDFGLWRGQKVNSYFVGLLDLIMTKYPETFECFTAKKQGVLSNEAEYVLHPSEWFSYNLTHRF